MSSKLFFTSTESILSATMLRGHIPTSSAVNTSLNTAELWTKVFAQGATLLSVEPVAYRGVASFGRVLGDESTLYKYLNPHLSVVTTLTPSAGLAHVYVLDTTTGHVVYSAEIGDVVVGKGLRAVMVENWLVYSWLESGGWRIASVELFEDRSKGTAE